MEAHLRKRSSLYGELTSSVLRSPEVPPVMELYCLESNDLVIPEYFTELRSPSSTASESSENSSSTGCVGKTQEVQRQTRINYSKYQRLLRCWRRRRLYWLNFSLGDDVDHCHDQIETPAQGKQYYHNKKSITSLRKIYAFRKLDRCFVGKAAQSTTPTSEEEHGLKLYFNQACTNCWQQYRLVRTLGNILTIMRERRIESAHELEESTTNNVYSLKRILEINTEGSNPENSFQGVDQMVRVCEWNCRIIEDELKWLQLILSFGGSDKKEYMYLFIEKWGITPNTEFIHISFHRPCPKPFEDVNIEEFLRGSITPNHRNVGEVMRFWTRVEKLVLEKAGGPIGYTSSRGPAGRISSTMVSLVTVQPNGKSSLQKRISERCLENVRSVQAILTTLYAEISRRFRLRGTQPSPDGEEWTASLYQALRRLSDMLYGIRAIQIKIERLSGQTWKDGDWKDLVEWISLQDNHYGQWITMSWDEFVEDEIQMPL